MDFETCQSRDGASTAVAVCVAVLVVVGVAWLLMRSRATPSDQQALDCEVVQLYDGTPPPGCPVKWPTPAVDALQCAPGQRPTWTHLDPDPPATPRATPKATQRVTPKATQRDTPKATQPVTPKATQRAAKVAADPRQFIDKVQSYKTQLQSVVLGNSQNYTFEGLVGALTFMVETGIDNKKFYIDENDVDVGLVNLAAFLGQCMQETLQYDACDENNWSSDATYLWAGAAGNKLKMDAQNSNAQGWLNNKPVSYPVTAACGQLGQSYEDYDCPDACPKLPQGTQLQAVTQAKWQGHPGPMGATGPNMAQGAFNFPPQTEWDALATNEKYVAAVDPELSSVQQLYCVQKPKGTCWNAPGTCGTSAGSFGANKEVISQPGQCLKPLTPQQVSDAGGGWSWLKKLPRHVCVATEETALKGGSTCGDHTDENSCQKQQEGQACTWKPFVPKSSLSDGDCNWWGRGVIQTTGRCNFGKLDKALRASSRYKTLFQTQTLCENPEMICEKTSDPVQNELRWISGLFYWVSEVQGYTKDKWSFEGTLKTFVDTVKAGGVVDDSGFVHNVSGIVNRGCPNPPCGTGALDAGKNRANNTCKVLQAMNFGVSCPDASAN